MHKSFIGLPPMQSMQTFREQCKKAAQDYYGDLPFHNFAHATSVEQRAYELCILLQLDELTTQGILLGAWMHDAGYHHPVSSSFSSKEDYSIFLMNQMAHDKLVSQYSDTLDEIIEIATQAIYATKIDCTDFSTEPRKILRAADIPNLGHPNETIFFVNSANIYREIHILHQEKLEKENMYPFPVEKFQQSQIPLLTGLLNKTEEGIPEEPYFFPGYYENFRANIARALSSDFVRYI